MSFGFSLSDIVVSYQLASDIYYRCFTKAQAAGALQYNIPSPASLASLHPQSHGPSFHLP